MHHSVRKILRINDSPSLMHLKIRISVEVGIALALKKKQASFATARPTDFLRIRTSEKEVKRKDPGSPHRTRVKASVKRLCRPLISSECLRELISNPVSNHCVSVSLYEVVRRAGHSVCGATEHEHEVHGLQHTVVVHRLACACEHVCVRVRAVRAIRVKGGMHLPTPSFELFVLFVRPLSRLHLI